MTEKEILDTIKQFVEGNLNIESFEKICKENQDFRSYIKDYQNYYLKNKNLQILYFLDNTNWTKGENQRTIQVIFGDLLWSKNIEHSYTDYYYDKAQKELDVLPLWLCDDAVEYVDENIIKNVPENLNKTQRKKWIYEQIKKTFPYRKRPPSWVQGTEGWPQDENGKFLTFLRQFDDGDLTIYVFINDDTNEVVTVEEFF